MEKIPSVSYQLSPAITTRDGAITAAVIHTFSDHLSLSGITVFSGGILASSLVWVDLHTGGRHGHVWQGSSHLLGCREHWECSWDLRIKRSAGECINPSGPGATASHFGTIHDGIQSGAILLGGAQLIDNLFLNLSYVNVKP